jgi:predicted CXXCH cytochrome family protein
MLTLEGQYLRKFSDPNVPQEAVVRRRIPDKDNSTRECVNTAFACAAEAAAADIREQFSVRGCISCHVVEEHVDSEIYARYQVHPVRLAQDYFPAGRFDHFSHQVMKEETGDVACLECHAANTSSESADLLIPDIDNCLGCHSDKPTAGRVTVGCVACHSYHPYASGYTGTLETSPL